MEDDSQTLHPHLEETVQTIAEIHAEHERKASLYERAIASITDALTRPQTAVVAAAFLVAWIVFNTVAPLRRFDPPPFSILQGLITLGALSMTGLILVSQRYDYRLAERRAQLTLQYALVSEQKVAKLIELVQQLRDDHPEIVTRHDADAFAMAKPADAQLVSEAVVERQREIVALDSTS